MSRPNSKERADNAVKHKAEQKAASVCYICGRRHAAQTELCPSCAEIIRTGLKLLRVS